jgi:hypothetical protein
MEALAEVRLTLSAESVRLVVTSRGKPVEDETWPLDGKVSQTEADVAARTCFDSLYDFFNFQVHGE